MKKTGKIFLVLLLILSLLKTFCYADEIFISPVEEFFLWGHGGIIIGGVVLTLVLISFFILRKAGKKEDEYEISRNSSNYKDIKYNILLIILLIMHVILVTQIYVPEIFIIWCIAMILMIMSKALRKSYRTASNIFLAIATIIIASLMTIMFYVVFFI